MRKRKQLISLVLAILMFVTSVPITSIQALADSATRHDFDVNFDYEYDTPDEALDAALQYKCDNSSSPYDSGIVWTHISSSYNNGDNSFRKKMMSNDEKDKYIILDKDIGQTKGYGDDIEVIVSSDKVLDLNGHSLWLKDIRNKVDTHDYWFGDDYWQSDNSADFNTKMFRIQNGATLTIIDSSKGGTGEVSIDAYMIDPYKYALKRYTTRDIFSIEDGNLITYGGTFKAGRSKQQSDDDVWEKIKTVVGSATILATDIAGYAMPINSATGKLDDVNFNVAAALKKLKKEDNRTSEDPPEGDSSAGNVAKDRSEGEPEKKKETPLDTEDKNGRNQTVDEKQKSNDKDKKNEANKNGTAKKEDYDGNSKIAEAQNAVTTAATNKDSISKMVDSAFNFAKSIKDAFGTNEGSIVTQSFLGTPVVIGNGGTFVSYGGEFIGYGMTPNVRNAVVECTQGVFDENGKQIAGGRAYIYGGTFEGRCGANVFNIVKENNGPQTFTQYTIDSEGNQKEIKVTVPPEETNWSEVVYLDPSSTEENIKLIDTRNIRVRGGVFRNYCEYSMVGLHEDKDKPNDHADKEKMTMFPGTKGSVNLSLSSFGEDLIRDGRIQIVDNHGDGALVLMDEKKDERGLHHYRLYCTEDELRYKFYLTVYPTETTTNSSHSFSLTTRYNGADTSDDISEIWEDNEENARGVYSTDEKFFKVEVDGNKMDTYYVVPELSNSTDVYNDIGDESEVWYYNTPVSNNKKRLGPLQLGDNFVQGLYSKTTVGGVFSQRLNSEKLQNITKNFEANSVSYGQLSYEYFRNLKWLTYKIYRVDPLTRENLTDTYGEDQPVKVATYGACTDDALRCQLSLNKLGIDYKPGEMYRVELTVDEYVQFGDCKTKYNSTTEYRKDKTTNLTKSSCKSSILFLCYSKNEIIDNNEPDFTPLQWVTKPEAGKTATVEIKNGKAGQIDWHKRKIFEVYYQWYAVDRATGKEEMIAGTDNIYDDLSLVGYNIHEPTNWQGDTTHVYKNTYPLPEDRSTWTYEDIHFYPQASQKHKDFTKDGTENLSLDNNNAFFTNTDSCYIPAKYNNHDIYCKAIVMNNYWPLNFDHKQTFRTPKEYVKTVKITFDPGDGQVLYGRNEKIASYLKKIGDLPTATKVGYTFEGWYVGEDKLTSDSIVRQTTDFVAKAKYSKNRITVTFDPMGGEVSPETKEVGYNEAYGTLPTPTKDGYIFVGWRDGVKSKTVTSSSLCTSAGKKYTLKAQWAEKCILTFDVNGGNTLSKNEYELAKGYQIGMILKSLPVPERDGYVFDGWYVSNNANKDYISVNNAIYDNATVKAHWSQKNTITLDANGGSCSTESYNVTEGQYIGTLPEPTKDEYKFRGWYTQAVGGKAVTGDTKYTKDITTLYAHWETKVAKVRFIILDDEGNEEVYAVRYTGQGEKIDDENFPEGPKKAGYNFAGWYKSKTGTGNFGPNDLCYGENDVYAVFSEGWIYIDFDPQGGLWKSGETQDYEEEGNRQYYTTYLKSVKNALDMTNDKFYRYGYKFLGWYTEADGGEKVDPDTICDWTDNKTYYAHWEPEMNYFSLVLGYEDAPEMEQYAVLSGEQWGAIPKPEREGYEFAGWYTGNGAIELTENHLVDAREIYSNAKEDAVVINDIFAHWTALPVEIELDKCVPNQSNEKLTVKGDETYGTLPVISRDGYKFEGWFTDKNGGEKITETSIYNTKVKALYAHWTREEYEATITCGENGTATLDKPKAAMGEEVVITVNPDTDCRIETIEAEGIVFDNDANEYTFKMPNRAVTINVTFHKHTWNHVETVEASIDQNGYALYTCECGESRSETVTYSTGEHNLVVIPMKAATCTEDGVLYSIYRCADCNLYFKDSAANEKLDDVNAVIVPKKGHTEAEDKEVAATCEESGKTKGSHCSVCGEVIVAQEEIKATGHTEVEDGEVAATCEEVGKTKGSHCSVCGKVITAQEEIKATGHTEAEDKEVAATCEESGKTKGSHCSVCGKAITAQEEIKATGHTEAEDKEVAATCEESGKTKGSHCSVCGKVITAQEEIKATGHTEAEDKEVAATCEESGKTKGSHCSVCGKVIVAQEEIKATGHNYRETVVKASTSEDGSIVETCEICGDKKNETKICKVESITISKNTFICSGKSQKPKVTVKDSEGKVLENGTDYEVSYSSGCKNVGKYYANVTLIGNYAGTKKVEFSILPGATASINAKVTANSVKLTWKEVIGAEGYQIYQYNTSTKKYVAVKKLTGTSCKITKLKGATTYKYAVRAYSSVNGTNYWSASNKAVTFTTKLSTPKLSVKAGKNKATISWNKQTGVNGYIVYMATSKNGKYKKIANISKGTKVSYSKSGLTKGKKYYFKVAAYKTVSGKKVYSDLSAVMYAKIK